MPTTKTFNNTSYNIPLEGELNWASLSSFLVDLADNAQTTNKQKLGTRVATASPVTVLANTDAVIITDLSVAGAVAVNLPAGILGQVFTVVDGKGDGGTNNITITPAAGTINGAATYVIDSNRAGVTLIYNGTEWTVTAEFISSGDIPRNQIAAGTANHVVINDGAGDLSSEAALSPVRGGTGVANNAAATLTRSGNHDLAITTTAETAVTLPTSGTLYGTATDSITSAQLKASLSDETGSGAVVFATSPTLVTPALGTPASGVLTNATGLPLTTGVTGTLPVANGGTGVTTSTGTTNVVLSNSPTLVSPALGTPSSATLTNATGLPISTGVSGLGAGVASFLATPSSANLASALTDETGSGLAVFGTSPVLTTPKIDGGTASNTSRITLPKDTKTNLDGLTRNQATVVYASDLNKMYVDDGSSLKEVGSGGSGINYLADYFTADTLGTVGNGNVTNTGNRGTGTFSAWQSTNTTNISLSVSGASPLRSPNCFLFTGSGNAAAGTTFVESPAFQLHVADLGKPVMVSFDIADVVADGNFDVCMVRYNSSGTYQEKISIAGNASGATPASAKLPLGVSKFNGFFVASSTATDYYALRFRRLAGTDVPRLDSIKVSPDTVVQGAAVTDWNTQYTFTTNASNATLTTISRIVGDSLEVYFRHVSTGGGVTGSAVTFTPPAGLTIDLTKVVNGAERSLLTWFDSGTAEKEVVSVISGNGIVFYTSGGVVTLKGTDLANGDQIVGMMTLPIVGWSSNVTMANRVVEEFAYNNSATTSTDTSSFAYGMDGMALQAFAPAGTAYIQKNVQLTTSMQASDSLMLEFNQSGLSWSAGLFSLSSNDAGTTFVGCNLVPLSSTTVAVRFYSAAVFGISWASLSSVRWRVRKVSGGASVGYPVSTANIVGRTDGSTVGSGYLGEIIEATLSNTSLTSTVIQNVTGGTLTLSAGRWLIKARAYFDGSGSTTFSPPSICSISTTTGTHDYAYSGFYPQSGAGDHPTMVDRYVSITSTTPYYLVVNCTFGASTAQIDASRSSFYAIRIA